MTQLNTSPLADTDFGFSSHYWVMLSRYYAVPLTGLGQGIHLPLPHFYDCLCLTMLPILL